MDQVGITQQAFLGLIVIGTVNIIGALSNLVPFYIVVQHWLLATDCNCIAVGLSLGLHPFSKIGNSHGDSYGYEGCIEFLIAQVVCELLSLFVLIAACVHCMCLSVCLCN